MYVGNLGVILLLLQYPHTDSSAKDYEGYTAFDLYNSTVQGTRPPIGTFIAPATSSKDAELFTWGTNRNASLGHGDTSDRTYPDHVSVPRPLAVGAQHDAANTSSTTQSTMQSDINIPVELRFARAGVRQVKMGRLHTAAISTFPKGVSPSSTSSGVSLCGFGSGGRLGLTQHTQYALRPLPFSGSGIGSSAAAAAQNQMPGSGQQAHGPGRVKIISVALGQDHTLALSADGEVYSWGLNRFAQLGYVIEKDDSGVFSHTHSATFQSQAGDGDPFTLSSSEFTTGGSSSSGSEQIQLTPRRVYGALKKEFVVGVAACKSASVCWVRTGAGGAAPGSHASSGTMASGSGLVGGSDGGNVYTWGLNSGQLGYDRTGSGIQLQIQPRKVTKITKPVVQIALGESAMVCLLGGTGAGKGDVVIVWGDRTARVNFPLHTFPSSITPYRPPQALKSTRIVKIVCSDEAPPAWSASILSALMSSTSGSATPSQQPSSSTSQLTRMMSAMSTSERDSNSGGTSTGASSSNLVHFACVSEGGEVFVFGVPGVPPIGALGALGSSSSSSIGSDGFSFGADGGFTTTGGGGSSSASKLEAIATTKLFKPQRVWGLKRGLVGAVRDVAIGAEGSLIVCTDSGHVYVRSRSNVIAAFDSSVGASKPSGSSRLGDGGAGAGAGSGGGKSQKFIRVPSLQRIVGVCASSTGAFGALRVDVDVEPVGDAKDMLLQKSAKGEDDVKGWDLVRDMKNIRPWMWVKKVVSPLDREWVGVDDALRADATATLNADSSVKTVSGGKAVLKEKDEDEDEDDSEIERDGRTLKEMSGVLARVVSANVDSLWEEKGRLPYGADVMVSRMSSSTSVASSAGQKKGKKTKALAASRTENIANPFTVPAHGVVLASRCRVLRDALSSTKDVVIQDSASSVRVRVFNATSKSSAIKTRRRVEFSAVHPLAILILLEYLYTDDLVAIWDRRVAKALDFGISHSSKFVTIMKEYLVSPSLASEIKCDLQSLGRLLDLPEFLRGMESSVKKPVALTLRKDLETLFWGIKHNNELPGAPKTRVDVSPATHPDVVLQLAEGKEVYMHSAILRARSVYFEDFLGDEEWTRNRWNEDDKLLKIDLKHMRWSVMEYVTRWMCCGIEEGVFGSLSFANSVDEVLEFLFEVIASATELLLSPLVLLASSMILKFLKISNACYILTEASHYHAYPLVASVQHYISCNLETFLECRMLEDLSPTVIKQLSTYIRSKQEEKAFFVRGGALVKRALEIWKDWVEKEDIPGIIIPSTAAQKRERERRASQTTKHSPSSPSHLSMTTMGKQREVHVTMQGSPILRPKASGSPIIKPKSSSSPLIKSKGDAEEIFDMDDMDIGPPSLPVERPPMTWKTSSTPRVDMRAVMAEAASSSDTSRPNPVYVPPRGSPGSSLNPETPFSSLRMRQKPSAQRSLSGAFDGPATPPNRPAGSPWKATATQSPNQASSSPAVQAKDSPPPMAASRSRDPASAPRAQPGQASLGPVFTPYRQPVSKPSPNLPRRTSSNTTKAWAPAPVHEPIAQSTAGMSFIAIQQLQLEQGAEVTKDKRSLLEIQQEEQAKREEEEFLKWWEAEEERVRLETEAALRMSMEASTSRGGSGSGRKGRGNNQNQRPRKTKAAKDSGQSVNPEKSASTGAGNTNRGGPKGKKGPRS